MDPDFSHLVCGCLACPFITLGLIADGVLNCLKRAVSNEEEKEAMELFRMADNMDYNKEIEHLKKEFEKQYSSCETKSSLKPGDFDFLKELGKGTFGEVYLAKHKTAKKLSAVKVFSKEKIRKLMRTCNLERERMIQNSVDFPFIVKLNATFSTRDWLFMVMDYCKGGHLLELVKMKNHLKEEHVRFYASQIFLAIDYLHSNNVIHRDIKLDNVVLCDDGYVKLTDFGFSKVIQGRTRTLCGSKGYVPPEILIQFLGMRVEEYGLVADWWSFGVSLYLMAVGDVPYPGDTLSDVHENIQKNMVSYPSSLSNEFVQLIKDLLVADPKARLGSKGAKEIKHHDWFKDTNWSTIFYKQKIAPYIPFKSSFQECKVDIDFEDDVLIDEFINF